MIFTVHFEKDAAGHPIRHIELEDKEVTEEEPVKTAEESMHEIVDAQKRVLDQWCFAEHYEPHVLLQVYSFLVFFNVDQDLPVIFMSILVYSV